MATFTPRVTLICKIINDRFPGLGDAGTYPGHGEDGSQFAADFWTTNKGLHDDVLAWVIENHKNLGVKYIISWKRIWSDARSSEGIRPYTRYGSDGTPSQLHTNHVHISFDPGAEDMAVTVNLSDATIKKIADAVANKDIVPNWKDDKDTNPTLAIKNALGEIGKQTKP